MNNYLTSFFIPSAPIAEAIALENYRLTLEDLKEDFSVSIDHEYKEEWNPPDRRKEWRNEVNYQKWRALMESIKAFLREEGRSIQREQIIQCQRVISQRLYRYLAFLARSSQAQQGTRFDIWIIVPEGMETMLGLAVHKKDREQSEEKIKTLLRELTGEFGGWLSNNCGGYYKAPWGEMHLEDHYLLLVATTFHESNSEHPYTEATFDPPIAKPGSDNEYYDNRFDTSSSKTRRK